jgi:hypothetical protein
VAALLTIEKEKKMSDVNSKIKNVKSYQSRLKRGQKAVSLYLGPKLNKAVDDARKDPKRSKSAEIIYVLERFYGVSDSD